MRNWIRARIPIVIRLQRTKDLEKMQKKLKIDLRATLIMLSLRNHGLKLKLKTKVKLLSNLCKERKKKKVT